MLLPPPTQTQCGMFSRQNINVTDSQQSPPIPSSTCKGSLQLPACSMGNTTWLPEPKQAQQQARTPCSAAGGTWPQAMPGHSSVDIFFDAFLA